MPATSTSTGIRPSASSPRPCSCRYWPTATGGDWRRAGRAGGRRGRQNYRLAYRGTAVEELSYRRFFGIDSLTGLRVERDWVFDDAHGLVLRLVKNGSLDGFRVDNVDGLADPEGYLIRLRAAT